MATIRTAIQIQDGMTPAMRSMTNALNICISSFETMHSASSRAVDTASLSAARAELNKASMAMDSVEKNIREADGAQQQLNNQMRNGQSAAEGLVNKVKQIATGIAAVLGVKQVLGLSDTMAQTTARLNLMNDGLQTTAQLQDRVFQSAQRSRSSYYDTATTVSKLGILAKDAFSNNQEMIVFAEQMNKQFKIGGAGIQEQASGMYQLTQAMASGRLQGDEFKAIIENAPLLARSIEQYMKNAGVKGTLKDWSSQGLITADVIKNALFTAADETNRVFATLPVTFGEVWNMIANNAGEIEDTKYVIARRVEDNQTLFDTIQTALDLTLENKKKLYVLYDNFGKLTLKNMENMRLNLLIDADTAENFDYVSSIDSNTYNKIKLFYDNKDTGKRELYEKQSGENINKWGVLQFCDSINEKTNGKAKADALLQLYNRKTRNLDINNACGDIRVRAGTGVWIRLDLGDITVDNNMLVERAKHVFKDKEHLMSLSLRGSDFI